MSRTPRLIRVGRSLTLMELSLVAQAVQFKIDAADPIEVSIHIAGLPEAMESKLQRIIRAGSDCNAQRFEPSDAVWSAREQLFSDPQACQAQQVSLLPTQWPTFIDRICASCAGTTICCHVGVSQVVGVGTLRA